MHQQDVKTIVGAIEQIDYMRFARRQYTKRRQAKAKYSAPSVPARKPCPCPADPPHEADVAAFTKDFAIDQQIPWGKASTEVQKYLAGGGQLPAHYRLERRTAALSEAMTDGETNRRSGHQAELQREQILKFSSDNPGMSYEQCARACGYSVPSSIPERIGG